MNKPLDKKSIAKLRAAQKEHGDYVVCAGCSITPPTLHSILSADADVPHSLRESKRAGILAYLDKCAKSAAKKSAKKAVEK